MEGSEAASDVLTGAVIADAVEPNAGARLSSGERPPACLNCGAALTGAYCAACGQSAHIHRTFRSLGHDILHSVFHFEGKLWSTIPELALRPGRLTRRYIEGERAKFISPMALFLLTVFVMYGIFAFLPDADWEDPPPFTEGSQWQGLGDAPLQPSAINFGAASEAIAAASGEAQNGGRREITRVDVPTPPRVELTPEVPALEFPPPSAVSINPPTPASLGPGAETASAEDAAAASTGEDMSRPERGGAEDTDDTHAGDGNVFTRAVMKLEENPDLVFYKMKSNGYKWSWLLVPFSIPFIWLLFFWRREFTLYDHAIFVTYSISFMMMLLIVSTLAQVAGVGALVHAVLLGIVPPLHLYRHLRGTYRLSRSGALVRLVFVLAAAATVLGAFATMLLLIGALE